MTDSGNAPQLPERRVGHPHRKRGYRIVQSAHRDFAAAQLLQGVGIRDLCRQLAGRGLKVGEDAMRGFRDNYVAALDQQVREQLVGQAKQALQVQQGEVVTEAVHHRISRVESLILLMRECERQIGIHSRETRPSPFTASVLGSYLDRLKIYRDCLSSLQQDSEVEIQRDKAIEAVADIAFKYLRDAPDRAEEFIREVAAYRERSSFLSGSSSSNEVVVIPS